LTLKHFAAPKTVATAAMLVRSVHFMLMVSTMSIRPSSAKVPAKRYFPELLISALKEESAAEEILPSQVALITTGTARSVAFATSEASMSRIRIKSLRESLEFPEASIFTLPLSLPWYCRTIESSHFGIIAVAFVQTFLFWPPQRHHWARLLARFYDILRHYRPGLFNKN
jgi:hypothetical protein